MPPLGETRPAWKVLRVLGNLFELEGFDQDASTDVLAELRKNCAVQPDNTLAWQCPKSLGEKIEGIYRIGETPIYSVDGITRRAPALQNTSLGITDAVYMNSSMLQRLGLAVNSRVIVTQGGDASPMKALIDTNMPDGCVLIPNAGQASAKLGPAGHAVSIEKD